MSSADMNSSGVYFICASRLLITNPHKQTHTKKQDQAVMGFADMHCDSKWSDQV
jgi:hypothetical protein